MANLLTFTQSHPVKSLPAGALLIEAGEAGGELYVLETGRLAVERDGIDIAEISEAGALIGEMSVLLGVDHSANVRALTPVRVRLIDDGIRWLEINPIAALHVATLACQRLNATSAMLVEMRKEAGGHKETGFLERLFGAVTGADVRS